MARSIGILASALALLVAGTAAGVGTGDYVGNVKGDQQAFVTFNVKQAGNGKRVKDFISDDVDFTCTVGTPGETEVMEVLASFPVDDAKFKGSGEAVGIPADPFGKVTGTLKSGGRAVGTLKLRGELDGQAGSHCTTGVVDWRAERNPPLRP